jgi:hypothetical protein
MYPDALPHLWKARHPLRCPELGIIWVGFGVLLPANHFKRNKEYRDFPLHPE